MNQYSNAALIADMQRHASLSREDNDRLYELVKAGDPAARQRMVEGNMYLVVGKVDCFLRQHHHAAYLRDDLTSAGFTGLLLAINAIARGEVTNINVTGYIAVTIGRELENLMDSENPIYVNGRCRRYARSQGYELEIPMVQAMPVGEEQGDSDDDASEDKRQERDKWYDPAAMVELRDVIEACCYTPEELEFVRMRESLFTYQEISARLNLALSSLDAMKKRIYARFLHKSGSTPQ